MRKKLFSGFAMLITFLCCLCLCGCGQQWVWHGAKDSTCDEKGNIGYYTLDGRDGYFNKDKVPVNESDVFFDALGHDWGDVTYTWSQDNAQCTATVVCANNSNHVQTETVNTTFEVIQEQTCDNAGIVTYTATFTNEAFETQTLTVQTSDAFGHDWGEVTYTWSQDNTQCTATRVCGNNGEHVETETVTVTTQVTQEQTCEDAELTTFTATFTNPAFATQIQENVQTKEALGHAWGEVTYTWSQDNSECTATRVCGNNNEHVETETVSATSVVTQQRTCENAELTTYTATFTNPVFAQQTQVDVQTQEAMGHAWGEVSYVWSQDNTQCTARRVCANNNNHVQEETVNTIADVTQTQTCENAEITTYTAIFTNEAFETQVKSNIKTQDSAGHNWGEVTYTWSEDNTHCTARRVCITDSAHVQEETVNTTADVTQEQSCVNAELTTFTATFTNAAFTQQTKTNVQTKEALGHDYNAVVTAPTCTEGGYTTHTCSRCGDSYVDAQTEALGHAWGEVTYTWSENNTKCTATRVCTRNGEHIETETVDTASEITQAQSCENAELTSYTAIFTNPAFETQTKTETTKEALGHNWGEATYIWSNNNTECTATRVCTRDASHVETETVTTTALVTQEQTCENAELTTYTAEFENPAFETQEETVQTQEALGHDWVVDYYWSQDYSQCTARRYCLNNNEHIDIEETVSAVSVVSQEQTCANEELTQYTATFTNPAFEEQMVELETKDPLGHDYNAVVTAPTCTEGGYTTYTCSRCGGSYVDLETEALGHDLVHHDAQEATCTEVGWNAYDTCSRCGYTTYEEIPALGHDYNAVVTAPTCTEGGYTTHTCSRCGDSYVDTQTAALGHNWGEVTYSWSNDKAQCTASRVCANDNAHVETETVNATTQVTQEQTCEDVEITRYTATFTNAAFATQTTTAITKEALGHNWGEATYTWSNDNTECTATRVCTRDASHIETETVSTTYEVTQAQSCENAELTTYTATFTNTAFETQIRENVQTKAALGGEHNYIYDTEKGKYVCTICGDEHNQTDSIYLQTSGTKLTGVDDNFEGALFVPNGITAIENSALYGNTKITEVYFPGTVQSVGQQAFRGCSGLTKVVFAEGVEVLDSQAFALCANLTDVSLPNTLTTINQNCFRQSSQLVNVNLPESLQRIGMYAFAQTGLTSVVVPSGLQDMDEYIFGACPALRTAIISEGITKVPNGMFRSCQALESIELPEGITEICDFAFDDCTSLTHVDFPSTLVEIKKAGFRKSALTSIVLPDGFKTLGIFVFEACTALKTAQLPNTLEEIGKCTFQGCVNLEQVNLPSSLKYIGNFGFNHCSSLQLTTITIPASVVQLGGEEFIGDNEDNNIMGSHMFYDCATASLIAFEVEEGNTHFVAKDGVLYTKNYKYLIAYPAANTRTSYTIEDGCEMAFELAFSRAHYLETLKLPNSFTVLPRTQLPEGWVNDTLNSIDAAVYVFNSISAYEVNEDNPNFKVVDGILYSKDGTKLISVPTRKWDSNGVLYFSEDLTTIDIILNALDTTIVYNDHEVGGCPSMIVLGAGVTNIGENGFYEISSSTVKILSEATARPSGWAEDLGINENKIYYYSETEQEGNYWHYVNDVPTVWGN